MGKLSTLNTSPILASSKPQKQKTALTQYSEGGIGRDCPSCVFGGAAVNAHVLRLDVHNEEHVVVRHDVHPALAGGGEIRPSIFLPGDLRRRVALSGALQPGRVARSDGAVPGGLHEGGENCGQQTRTVYVSEGGPASLRSRRLNSLACIGCAETTGSK